MSGRIVSEVMDHAPDDLRPLDFLVLIALAEDAFDSDRTARRRCSSDELAYRVRSSPSSVRNALSRLKQRALIRPVHQVVGPGRQQNWVITKLSSHHREGARVIPITRNQEVTRSDPPNAQPGGDT